MLDIKITRTATPKAKPTDETKLGFGKKFSDHMFVMDYTEGEGWHDARIVPYVQRWHLLMLRLYQLKRRIGSKRSNSNWKR